MGKRLALLVGVSEYGEGFEPLPGSLRDVQAMQTVLKDPERGAFEVDLLQNCDRTSLEAQIEQLFSNKQADDLLLFYFSGHGDLGSGGMLYQQLHLCAHNTHKQGKRLVESSALSAGFLKRQMDLSRSQQIVVILDCCYSGAIADLLRKGDSEIDFGELKAKGRVILASSSAVQVALQAKDGLSLYTRYLIEGMEGAAYPGQGEWIVAQDLHKYAERRFEIESKGGYLPKIIAEDTGFELPIVRPPKPDAKLQYRQRVDQIFQELDQDLGLAFTGAIEDDYLARTSLNTLRDRLQITLEEAQTIEAKVQQPYLVRAQQRHKYADCFRAAVRKGYLPTDYDRRRLTEIRQDLLLGKEDADRIERELTQQLNLKPVPAGPAPPIDTQNVSKQFEFDIVKVNAQGKVNQSIRGQAELFSEDLGNGVVLDLVKIPGGQFLMGSPEKKESQQNRGSILNALGQLLMGSPEGEQGRHGDEGPQHQVNIQPFWMGKFPVTQGQWAVVATWPKVEIDLQPDPSRFKGANRPVEQVSWDDAVEFCARLTRKKGRIYRLPSEAEWEYACRAGTTTPFYFGETITTDLANYRGTDWEFEGKVYKGNYGQGPKGEYRKETTDVGKFPPNSFGLYEMHGNIWEWCEDKWHENYIGAPSDGTACPGDNENGGRLLRGGSCYLNPVLCRAACRGGSSRDARNSLLGVRVVVASPRT
jgi:formylglycine-generating enzyme required for sulfatase activity